MFVAIMSRACFHCLFVDQLRNQAQLDDQISRTQGSPCPTCSVTVDEIELVMLKEGLEILQNENSEWNRASEMTIGLRDIYNAPDPATPYQTRSRAAEQLFGQVQRHASSGNRAICDAITQMMANGYAVEIGRKRYEDGDPLGALESFEKALGHFEDEYVEEAVGALSRLGWELDKAGDRIHAKRAYKAALSRATGEGEATTAFLLGVLLHVERKDEEAEKFLARALSSQESWIVAAASFRLGQILHFQCGGGDESIPPEAASYYERAMQIDGTGPTAAKAAYNMGFIWKGRGKLKKALEMFEFAASYGGDEVIGLAHLNAGRVHAQRADGPAAAASFRKAMDSTNREAADLARSELSTLDDRHGSQRWRSLRRLGR